MSRVPKPYQQLRQDHPDVLDAYERFNDACKQAGPLDDKTTAIVKLAVSLAAGLDGAARSHARKAADTGWSPDELMHVATLCAPTIGFPNMMRARDAVRRALEQDHPKDSA